MSPDLDAAARNLVGSPAVEKTALERIAARSADLRRRRKRLVGVVTGSAAVLVAVLVVLVVTAVPDDSTETVVAGPDTTGTDSTGIDPPSDTRMTVALRSNQPLSPEQWAAAEAVADMRAKHLGFYGVERMTIDGQGRGQLAVLAPLDVVVDTEDLRWIGRNGRLAAVALFDEPNSEGTMYDPSDGLGVAGVVGGSDGYWWVRADIEAVDPAGQQYLVVPCLEALGPAALERLSCGWRLSVDGDDLGEASMPAALPGGELPRIVEFGPYDERTARRLAAVIEAGPMPDGVEFSLDRADDGANAAWSEHRVNTGQLSDEQIAGTEQVILERAAHLGFEVQIAWVDEMLVLSMPDQGTVYLPWLIRRGDALWVAYPSDIDGPRDRVVDSRASVRSAAAEPKEAGWVVLAQIASPWDPSASFCPLSVSDLQYPFSCQWKLAIDTDEFIGRILNERASDDGADWFQIPGTEVLDPTTATGLASLLSTGSLPEGVVLTLE